MSHYTPRLGAIVAVFMAATASAATHAHAQGARAVIRLYDITQTDVTARAMAMRAAASILAKAGVVVEWRDCSRDGASYPCRAVPDANELVIRIMPASTTPARPSSAAVSAQNGAESDLQLGFAAVDPSGRANVMATIYRDRIFTVMRRAGVDFGDLLGRAMAHEIGHLLLRVPGHARTGLMRGIWTDAELIQNRETDWAFTEAEARRMQSTLLDPTPRARSAHAFEAAAASGESAFSSGR
ncbi:MAG TPA: hypothetical protein VGQ37_08210 [Vicinamibacterales bacterium]|jgi:hypothetical protein|nr:hypothetical protein [Vicinamibacterales bacterium]